MLIYTNDRSRRQQRKLPREEREAYAAWCKKYNIDPLTGKSKIKPVGSVNKHPTINPVVAARMAATRAIRSVDSGHTGAVYTKSMMDPLQWRGESQEEIDKIVAKSKRLAPAYSKGAVQYVSDGTDPSDLGKKK